MPEAEIETLRASYEAFNRGDWDSLEAAAHPDLELVPADRALNQGTQRGAKSIRAFFEDLFAPFDEVLIDAEAFHQRGDRIVVFVRALSRPRGSSAVVDNRIAHVWSMQNGAPIRLEIFPNRDDALAAADSRT
jgi:ketosteroid isomerase-like protein